MKLLIGYASREGQTRKIARYAADFAYQAGHSVELLNLKDADGTDLSRFDKVLLAAPIHIGHYPKSLAEFAAENEKALNTLPTGFLSVSLSAAGHEADDWKALDKILEDLEDATGWTPGKTEQVAGAYLPSKYDVLTRFIMIRILTKRSPQTELDVDKEFTDWKALDDWLADWLAN